MSESRNWKALAIPSIDGSKTELDVTGEVQSGFNPTRLTKREKKEKRPANVFALDIANISGGEFTKVQYKGDITGGKYDIVLVYNDKDEIEAAIRIEAVKS